MSTNFKIVPARVFQTVLAVVVCTGAATAAETKAQTFSVPQAWHVPAATLPPGSYSISIVDQMADRSIVKVESADGSTHATFIAIPNFKVALPSHAGPVMWPASNGGPYVRGWRFPGSAEVLEFAYPKADAVSIARHQKVPVPAVDPDSEGMKAVPNALASKSDMEVINLWLLSANQVGPDPEKAEIKAARYQPGAAAPQPKHVAAVTGTHLPKTGSNLILLALISLLSFASALSLWVVRTRRVN